METLPVLRKRSSLTGGEILACRGGRFLRRLPRNCHASKITVTALAETINQGYDQTNLSFAIRVYAFLHTPQRPESSAVSSITPNSSTK